MNLYTINVLLLISIVLLFNIISAAPLASKSTCPCREQNFSKVSICAETAGDPAWCKFHMCAPSYECIDAKYATNTCKKSSTIGLYKCLLTPAGLIIKPKPHEHERCKCAYFGDQQIHHLTPIN